MTTSNDTLLIGCCGACCKTCRALADGSCRGCKLGYDSGERDINRIKCKIKTCCFKERRLQTCADCGDYDDCRLLADLYGKKGYKYGKYQQSTRFIRTHGYARFLEATRHWKGPYGKLG